MSDLANYLSTPRSIAIEAMKDGVENKLSEELKTFDPNWRDWMFSDETLEIFLPTSWTGIKLPPIELEWSPDTPTSYRDYEVKIPHYLKEAYDKEMERLCRHFLRPSISRTVSALVVAKKATTPFIRLCGNYVYMNKFILSENVWHPDPRLELERLTGYNFYDNLDLFTSYHQWLLGPITSERLAILTPNGIFEPIFMPEGIKPASSFEKRGLAHILAPIAHRALIIHDNILLMGKTLEELSEIRKQFFDLCTKWNLKLKWQKCEFGVQQIEWFGYIIGDNKYWLSEKRTDAISIIPFPKTKKKMQAALGALNFCSTFIPHYSELVAPLYDTTKPGFNWDDSTSWPRDYHADFDAVKQAVKNSMILNLPDYTKPMVTAHDSSKVAAAAILYQLVPDNTGISRPCLVAIWHKKYSGASINWPIPKKEAFAIVAPHKEWERILLGVYHVVMTDHANLLRTLEVSTESIIQRWILYMQSNHNFLLVSKPAKEMKVPDFLTRMDVDLANIPANEPDPSNFLSLLLGDYDEEEEEENDQTMSDEYSHPTPSHILSDRSNIYSQVIPNPTHSSRLMEMFTQIHNSKLGHCGCKRAWNRMNYFFPGHGFSYLEICTMVQECVTCQKTRLGHDSAITPMTLNLRQPTITSMIGIDFLEVSPVTSSGNKGLCVIVNHFSKMVALYPVKNFDAESAALSLLAYRFTYGPVYQLISDPGSHFTARAMELFNEYMGVKHLLSLVDRHESCGVERHNKELLRHIIAACYDLRIKEWDSPHVLPLIADHINSEVNSETGYSPYSLTFDEEDAPVFNLPLPDDVSKYPTFIKDLATHLKTIRAASKEFQDKVRKEREGETNLTPNKYQAGDFVLFELSKDRPKPTKITPRYKGSYEVIYHKQNTVNCRHVVMHNVENFHVSDSKIFAGTKEQAFEAALRDYDQYVVKEIHAYRGDPKERTQMQFVVEFSDGTIIWKFFSKDLWENAEFERYCNANRPLQRLNRTADIANKEATQRNRKPITEIQPGNHVFVGLRAFGFNWYDTLTLPQYRKPYVFACTYGNWTKGDNNKHLRIDISIDLLPKEDHSRRSSDWVYTWGTIKEFNPDKMILIDEPLLAQLINMNPNFTEVEP